MLLTRHLLFVGFGLADDHFHEVVHDVRTVRPGDAHGRMGAALVLSGSTLRDQLWGDDLDIVPVAGPDAPSVPEQGRRLEIFLDYLLAHADSGLEHMLDTRYAPMLSTPERTLADRLRTLADDTTDDEWDTDAGRELTAFLRRLDR